MMVVLNVPTTHLNTQVGVVSQMIVSEWNLQSMIVDVIYFISTHVVDLTLN
jgi:hypothetical protein